MSSWNSRSRFTLTVYDVAFHPVQTLWIISGCQSSPKYAFLLGQFRFSSWTPMPFKHICGYITLHVCVFGHQIIRKSLQFTNHVRMDNSIICLIIPVIATLIHWTNTSIYTLICCSSTLIYTNSLIISFLTLSNLQVGASQASWQPELC